MNKSYIVAINKPKGMTSHDVVDEMRRITKVQKVGHAGTLDPLATGVLVVGIGREATKQLGTIVQKNKEYLATIRLGMYSSTDDEEGEKEMVKVKIVPDRSKVEGLIFQFIGDIEQIPPQYSAIKIKGKAAYRYARAGKQVTLKSRRVRVDAIELLDYSWPDLHLRVNTGPGVYIRSLARDMGHDLHTGGYLSELTRTRVGEYRLERAIDLDSLHNHLLNH